MLLIITAYFAIFAILGIYGLHRIVITRAARGLWTQKEDPNPPESWPTITVQLPIYNEKYVVSRLLDAVLKLDYPNEKLHIQILDDSTDETSQLIKQWLHSNKNPSHITYLHRTNRMGYKACALENGLKHCQSELVAVFDADFVPPPSFLRQMVPHFTNEKIGMVQGRWDHLNRDHSLLTQIQAIMLDAHFVLEHAGRYHAGLFFNFNGTAGIWRKQTIEDAGGWQHDTITEDLDLSYRAQIKGWQFVFVPQVTCPAELPVSMAAFKSQQHRWAKGSIQVMKKILPKIWSSPVTFKQKMEATFHLTGNLAYLLMVINSLFFVIPSLFYRAQLEWKWILLLDAPLFLLATGSFIYFYVTSQILIGKAKRQTFRIIPALMALGIGLGVNNSRAVIEALLGYTSGFVRTPKVGESKKSMDYRLPFNPWTTLELLLGVTYVGAFAYATLHGWWASIPFLMLFLNGFGLIGLITILEQKKQRALNY